MLLVISVLSLTILACLFVNYRLGISILTLYTLLVPIPHLFVGEFTIARNVVIVLYLFMYFFKYRFTIDWCKTKLYYPFIILYTVLFVFSVVFCQDVPIDLQFTYFRLDIMKFILPFILINLIGIDNKALKIIKSVFYCSIYISTIYGLSLTLSLGVNPYIDYVNQINPELSVGKDQSAILQEGLRLFGYISSCFSNVTVYGMYLIACIVLVFNDYMHSKEKKWIYIIPLCLLILNVIICGSRSVLYGFIFTIFFYLFIKKDLKTIAYAGGIGVLALITFYIFLPGFFDFFMSFQSSNNIGSTTNMRAEQFLGCYEEFQLNPLFGHGYNWTNFYNTLNAGHPTMLYFESILIQIICNSGLLGLLSWSLASYKYCTNLRDLSIDKESYILFLVLLVGFYARSFLTGDYGQISYIYIVFAIMLGSSIQYQK